MQSFYQPALSFETQPDLEQLFQLVITPPSDSGLITLFCGAGVSVEAGLPAWDQLVRNICDLAPQPLNGMLKADTTDPMRKVEYALRMAEDRRKHSEELVRDSLYEIGKDPLPSLMADSVARIKKVLPDRVRIVTTNFDHLLEAALVRYFGKATPFGLKDVNRWLAEPVDENHVNVLHLHGMVEPGKRDALRPLILSESFFQRYGPRVRRTVRKILEESDTIFVGVSLADPNLVGPLTDLRKHQAKKRSKRYSHKAFLLTVPNLVPGYSAEESFDYSCERASYFEEALGVTAIHLKAYSQIPQVLYDFTLAAKEPDLYMSDDPATSLRYGHRLERALDVAYARVEHSSAKAARKVSTSLHRELNSDEGPLAFLEEFRNSYVRSKYFNRYGIDRQFLDGEHFSLYLWLRTPRNPSSNEYSYSLRLVASSAVSHRDEWSIRRDLNIVPGSDWPVVQAAYYGNARWDTLEDFRLQKLWKYAINVNISTVGDEDALDILNVGVLSLQSTRPVVDLAKMKEDRRSLVDIKAKYQPSILSFLPATERTALNKRVEDSALRVLGF